MALHKAKRGSQLTWIGILLSISVGERLAMAEVPEDKLVDIEMLTKDFLGTNVVPNKRLRTYTGKVQSLASVLFALRPFVKDFWAALYDPSKGAPNNCTWTRQMTSGLKWMQAFLRNRSQGPTVRKFSLDSHLNNGPPIFIATDASPCGFGGVLYRESSPLEYFACPVTRRDEIHLGVEKGDHLGQQVWEALAMLIALRQWAWCWKGQRMSLTVRGDHVTALTMVRNLKAGSPALANIAR